MHYVECEIQEKEGFVVAIGDIHMGDPAFTEAQKNRLKRYIDFVGDNSNARVILMGDLVNMSTRISPTKPWDKTEGEEQQIIDLFSPIKDKIICGIEGNHELRLTNFCGYSVTQSICRALNIAYGGFSTVVNVKVRRTSRKETKRGEFRGSFTFFAHHTRGGGGTSGGKVNRVDKLRQIVVNADVYLGGHTHLLSASPLACAYVDTSHKQIAFKDQWIISTGSYLEWNNSYAEESQLTPNKLGSPIIKLNGLTHKINVEL